MKELRMAISLVISVLFVLGLAFPQTSADPKNVKKFQLSPNGGFLDYPKHLGAVSFASKTSEKWRWGADVATTREAKKGRLSIHGGPSFPYEDFSDNYKMGFSIQGDAEYIFVGGLSISALVGYNRFPAKIAEMSDCKIINANVLVRFYPFSLWRIFPFLEVGPGYYRLNDSINKIGLSGGLGIRCYLNLKIALELGIYGHSINTTPVTAYQDYRIGLILVL